jgi:hypothetical protein
MWPFKKKQVRRGPERSFLWRQHFPQADGSGMHVYMRPGVQLCDFTVLRDSDLWTLQVVAWGRPGLFGEEWLAIEKPDASEPKNPTPGVA